MFFHFLIPTNMLIILDFSHTLYATNSLQGTCAYPALDKPSQVLHAFISSQKSNTFQKRNLQKLIIIFVYAYPALDKPSQVLHAFISSQKSNTFQKRNLQKLIIIFVYAYPALDKPSQVLHAFISSQKSNTFQ